MSKKVFMKIMGEIDDEILERFDKVERKFTAAAARRRVVRTVTLIAACVVVVASLVAVPALISSADDTPPEETGTSTTTTTKKTTNTTTTKPIVIGEPDPIFEYLDYPCAIVKIHEATEIKLRYLDRVKEYYLVQVKCEVLYNYRNEFFIHYPGIEVPDDFTTVTEIYVEEEAVKEMAQYEIVMLSLDLWQLNGKAHYMTSFDSEGKTTFLPFVDGKIVIDTPERMYFGTFGDINEKIEKLQQRPTSSEALKELPKEKFENGMTYEQVTAFLDACKKVLEIHYSK